MAVSPTPLPEGYPDKLPPVELRVITKETYRSVFRLKTTEDQERFVAPNTLSLAQAYFHPEARPFGLFAGELLVGFVMLSLEEIEQGKLWIWRFMIDSQHQAKGFGQQAIDAVMRHARSLGNVTEVKLSHVDKLPGQPGPFYISMGFEYTGEQDEDELVMRRSLAGL